MTQNSFSIKVGGEAGMGIKVIGLTIAKVCTRSGLFAYGYLEYPSLIRGGHNTYQVVVRPDDVHAQWHAVDILLAFNRETATLHRDELTEHGAVVCDAEKLKVTEADLPAGRTLVAVPLAEFATQAGNPKTMNTVAVGAVIALLDGDLAVLKKLLTEEFTRKGDEVVQANVKAAELGYTYAKEKYASNVPLTLKKVQAEPHVLITGNEAMCLGAIKSGVKFVAAYPMTPSSSILHYMASKEQEYDIVVKHTEDEIAAMNMICGAAYAGVRTLTSTSGGGFSLMVEALGMAGIAELPVVIAMSQRYGPSTGMPTWGGQADLRFVIHASQGEFPRIVIAPGDAREAFEAGLMAPNLAEKYQLPVIVLLEHYVSESSKTALPFTTADFHLDRGKMVSDAEAEKLTDYKRYLLTDDGISPRVIPGQPNGMHIASSYEHDEYGTSEEREEMGERMQDKRMKKLDGFMKEQPLPKLYGPADAALTIVSWGGTKGPIMEAMRVFEQKKLSVNFLHFVHVFPFPARATKLLASAKKTLLIEMNKTLQFGGLVREYTGITFNETMTKYGGREFFPEEIIERVQKLLA